MNILEPKNAISGIFFKSSLGGFSKGLLTEESINKLKLPNLENRKKRLKKINELLVICGAI